MIPVVGVAGSFRGRRWLMRLFGWLALAVVVPVLAACTARSLEPPELVPEPTGFGRGPVILNRNVDLLFLVDDSSSMKASQDNLLANFPVLMTALENMPGGLPNVHIAVVSSDMGAGDGSISGCSPSGGKNGIFQYTARQPCTATGLDAGATFISNIGGVKNYTGNLPEVFTCIAALGQEGCGFEHQFAAITRALGADGRDAPIENQGFLRPDAYLAIVMITNEDDCSAPAGSPLFDTSANRTLASVLGPPSNFRCNEFGHLCDGAPPSRFAPGNDVAAAQAYGNCVSAEGSGQLLTVADTAARIKALKPDPDNQIIVAGISGPETPYNVHWKMPSVNDTGPWPEISHSCTSADGSFADPSVRTSQLVRQFGGNGLLLPICTTDFRPALQRIADKIIDRLSKPCIVGTVAKRPGTTSDDCNVVSTSASTDSSGASGRVGIESAVRSCADTGGVGPCWRFVPGENACTGQGVEMVADPAAPPPAWQSISVQCSLCVAGVPDPARGCP
jgi:hypothetical protein